MIFLVDGTPGAGKSYYAVRQIADALAAGKSVVTNVPLSDDFAERVAAVHPLRRFFPSMVRKRASSLRDRVLVTRSLEDVMRVRLEGSGEGRGIVVLDEAHVWLNSRMWGKDTSRAQVIEWFSGHRHFGFDIYLISQHIEDIDKQVRNRVEYRVRLRNLKRVRVAGVRVIPCNVFVAISELISARQAPIAKRDYYLLNKRLANMYSTHGLADGDIPDDAIWLPRPPAPGASATEGGRHEPDDQAHDPAAVAGEAATSPSDPLSTVDAVGGACSGKGPAAVDGSTNAPLPPSPVGLDVRTGGNDSGVPWWLAPPSNAQDPGGHLGLAAGLCDVAHDERNTG